MLDLSFYKGKKVLVTGHTGFKGTWLCKILINSGAVLYGYSLEPLTQPNLFELSGIKENMVSIIGDIRDYDHLKETFDLFKPEIVIHLAAQPIVRDSYKNPKYTRFYTFGPLSRFRQYKRPPTVHFRPLSQRRQNPR